MALIFLNYTGHIIVGKSFEMFFFCGLVKNLEFLACVHFLYFLDVVYVNMVFPDYLIFALL